MKKTNLILTFFLAIAFMGCGSNASSDSTSDSTVVTTDTVAVDSAVWVENGGADPNVGTPEIKK